MKDPQNVWQEKNGKWYHRTEDEDMIGPFNSEDEATEALDRYCEWLNKPKPTPWDNVIGTFPSGELSFIVAKVTKK